ncbi:DEAD/DEAH box helicase [Niabella terrae]
MSFNNLPLIAPLLRAVSELGYNTPSPVQEQSIPIVLKNKDLIACAQTGTGKTAAFALPLLQLMSEEDIRSKNCRALILTPTRELALQVAESFKEYGKYLPLKHLAIFGGVSQVNQVRALQQRVDILIATPGRLLDLMQQGLLSLRDIKYLVLDEADRMLDMGFIHDVRRILSKLPAVRQTILFSATMPMEIQRLSQQFLNNPSTITITPPATTVDRIQQSVYFADKGQKLPLLLDILHKEAAPSVLVFTRTKHGADKVVRKLIQAGFKAAAIHGNKSQNARQTALGNFKSGAIRVLVATDIAARGIDIDQMGLVINFELPNEPDTYVHRIGRTGRAGADGVAISFCDAEERPYLRDIQKLIRKTIPVVEGHAFEAPLVPMMPAKESTASATGHRNSSGQKNNAGKNKKRFYRRPASA